MSNEPRASMNVDPELLAAYIDRRVSPEQRAAVEVELAKDPDSYAVLVETIRALEQMPDEARSPVVRPSRRWTIAAGILAAAAALILVIRVQPDLQRRFQVEPSGDALVAKLADAIGEERYIESRLPGPFRHGPLRSPKRGSTESDAPNLSLLAVTGEIQQAYDRSPSLDRLRALGAAFLVSGRHDDAIAILGPAATANPDDAAILIELSAAYLERGRMSGSADRARALDLARRAAQADPASPAALFNLAIALEASDRIDEATAAWQRAAAVEQDPAWQREAVQRMERLRTR